MTLRLIDLFSGAGGMSLGFCDKRFCGGFTTVLALDNDAAAVKTHELNFPGRAVQANIEEWLLHNEVPQADVVIAARPAKGSACSTRSATATHAALCGSPSSRSPSARVPVCSSWKTSPNSSGRPNAC